MARKYSRFSLSARPRLENLLRFRKGAGRVLRFDQFTGQLSTTQEASIPEINPVSVRDGVKSPQKGPATGTVNQRGSCVARKRADPFTRLPKKPMFFALLLCVVAVLLFSFFRGPHASVQQAVPGANVEVDVYPDNPTISLSQAFDGLSIESADTCATIKVEKQNPVLDQLFRNLGPAVMRYGGTSVDNVYWSPDGTSSCSWQHSTFNKKIIDDIFAFAKKVGWKVVLGVNLKNGNPASAAAEAAYAARIGGSTLLAIELGNEPEFYGWSYMTYQSTWDTFAARIKGQTPDVPLTGPAITFCCKDFFTPFLHTEGRKLAVAVGHWYPEFFQGTDTFAPTISNLLSYGLMDRTVRVMTRVLATAKAQDLPFYLDETNAIAGSPLEDVGHSVAMALWAADYMFTIAELGGAGMNFHGGYPGDGTSPLLFHGTSVVPQALYYGMLLFHYAAANGKIVPTYVISTDNVTAHSVLNEDGTLRVVLINKEQKTATVQIKTTQSYHPASAIGLVGPLIPATSGVMLGGTTTAADGTWKPKTSLPILVRGASSYVSLPATSAVVLTYERGNT